MDECQNVIIFDDLDTFDIDDATDFNMVIAHLFYHIFCFILIHLFISNDLAQTVDI